MAIGIAIAGLVVGVATAVVSADAARRQAHMAEDAAIQQAQQAEERAIREEQIAKEKKEADIAMASERLTFEKETRGEKAKFTIGQMEKVTNELRAAAIAGYAASGIGIEAGSSALTVISRIRKEGAVETGEVAKDYASFVEARDIEFEQLKTSRELTYDWFTTRLHQETQWEIRNRYAEAAAYRTKAKYATYGGYLGVASAFTRSGAQAYEYGII